MITIHNIVAYAIHEQETTTQTIPTIIRCLKGHILKQHREEHIGSDTKDETEVLLRMAQTTVPLALNEINKCRSVSRPNFSQWVKRTCQTFCGGCFLQHTDIQPLTVAKNNHQQQANNNNRDFFSSSDEDKTCRSSTKNTTIL